MMSAQDKEAAEVEGSQGSGSRRSALWSGRVAKFLTSCSGSLGSTGMLLIVCSLSGIPVGGIRYGPDRLRTACLYYLVVVCALLLGALDMPAPIWVL